MSWPRVSCGLRSARRPPDTGRNAAGGAGPPVKDVQHSVWGCPCNEQIEDRRVAGTQHLVGRALADGATTPCFWHRGLLPATWTYKRKPFDEVRTFRHTWGLGEGPFALTKYDLVSTDGSGGTGPASKDWRLRRAAWGWVVTDPATMLPYAGAYGSVDGAQTVPRAELSAIIDIVQSSTGDLVITVDASFIKPERSPRSL